MSEQSKTETWDYNGVNQLLDLTDVYSEDEEENTETTVIEDEFDDELMEEEEPKKKGFAKNPFLKMALIGGIIGAGALFIGAIFSLRPTTQNNVVEVENSEPEEIVEEIGNEGRVMASQVALAEQERRMRELGEQMDRPVPTLVVDEEITPPEPVIIEPEPAPQPPAPIMYEPEPEPFVFQEPAPEPPPSVSAPAPPPAPEPPPVHSMQDWLALANIGSYGGGVINNEQSRQTSQPRQVVNNNQPTAQQVSQQITRQPSLSSDERRLMGNTRTIRAGTRVKAEIVNSMIAVQGESPLLAVITSEPIEVDGRVVIPTGTEIIFESAVHSSGMVIGNAISLFMDSREIELPPQVLQLRASEGQPLMAQRQNNPRGDILRRDAGSFVLGALGKVGEISNRPRTTSTFNGISGSGTTSSFDEPNYTGAILEGGFNPLARQWESRNQQAISQLQGQGDIWMIPLNQPVEIIIARSFSM